MSRDAERTKHTFAWLQQVARDRNMPGRTGAVAIVLVDYRNRDSWNAWPSIAGLAEKLGMTRQGVQNLIRAMEGAGHLDCEIGGGPGGKNLYRFLLRPPKDVGTPPPKDVGTPCQRPLPDLPTDVSKPANGRLPEPSYEPLDEPSDEP